MSMITSRRELLRQWTLLAATQVLPASVAASIVAGRDEPPASQYIDLVRDLFENPSSPITIGQAAAAQESSLAEPAMIAQALHDSLCAIRSRQIPTVDALRRRISAHIRADFATGRTYSIDGWILAQTEVRFCALLAHSRAGIEVR